MKSHSAVRKSYAVAVTMAHFAIWIMTGQISGKTLPETLNQWDSYHFSAIATEGYNGPTWAFYPLYPLVVRGATWIANLLVSTPPQVAGAAASNALFALFVVMVALQQKRQQNSPANPPNHVLFPLTQTGWLLFLFSPASHVFHSNHTESLYLLLTYGAFCLAFSPSRWIWAAVLAGLSALTRNHGVFAAITVAVISGSQMHSGKEKVRRFIASGIISGGLFALFPVYQYIATGNPLEFVRAHENWSLPSGPGAYFATFWFGNPIQNLRPMSILHHVFVALLGWTCWLWWKRCRPISLYIAMYLVLMPAQLEFVDAFRFGSVLWPVFFLLGDLSEKRLNRMTNTSLLAAAIAFNIAVAAAYGFGRWAY